MKRTFALAVSLLFAAGTAMAMHCPTHGKAIDEALAKAPKLTEAQAKEVKDLKKKGEDLHKAGNHKEAMENMHKAMDILGMKHE
jgi:hypothetical protein